MTRLVHLSDLHFGRERPELLTPLLRAVEAARPDLIAISGDLTQRARESQFARARAFLDRLPAPWLCVPGNHDVPLENWPLRLIRPYRAWARAFGRDLEPELTVGEIRAIGLNTVSPFLWQRGWTTRSAVKRLRARLADAPPGRLNVLVAHHPFAQDETVEKDLMRGARRGIAAVGEAGVDVILCGHLHQWRAAPLGHAACADGALQIQVGTSLSSRGRGAPNDFAVLHADGPALRVERMVETGGVFTLRSAETWRRTPLGWRNSGGAIGAAPAVAAAAGAG